MSEIARKSYPSSLIFNVTSWDGITNAIESNVVLAKDVNQGLSKYHTIDVSVAMSNLASVGSVLKLAYAGSKGFPCSAKTIEILCQYQTLIKNSYITGAAFVDACLSALKYHKTAVLLAEKDKLDKAFGLILKCSELASKMAEESEKLVKEAQKLVDLSTQALVVTQNDENITSGEKKRIEKFINESKERQAELETKTKQLYSQINELKEAQIETAKKLDSEREKAFFMNVLSAITEPVTKIIGSVTSTLNPVSQISNILGTASTSMASGKKSDTQSNSETDINRLDSEIQELEKTPSKENQKKIEDLKKEKANIDQANRASRVSNATGATDNKNNSSVDALQQKEIEIMKLKNELQKEERDGNAELASIGSRIKSLKAEDNDLKASIASLELAIQALGKVKTIFEQTRQFWLGVKKQCEALSDVDILKTLSSESDLKEEFIDQLKESGLNWLTLGRINLIAATAIRDVDAKTDKIMENLPTKREALQIVQTEADSILNGLQSEVSALTN